MLIGNPADFDRIRARYEALRYPTPAEASFNAARTSYEGLLTGSGFDTTMVPTTTPGEGVTFSVDPVTGQVTTNVPEYEVPTFETIYDAGEGLIGSDGRPIPDEISPVMGQALSAQRGGEGRNRQSNFAADTRNFGQLASDVDTSLARNLALGMVNPAFGLLGQLGTMSDQKALKDFGINTKVATQQIADVYNKALQEGKNPNQALQDAAIMGGVALTDKAFEDAGIPDLSINQQLKDFQAKKDPSGKGPQNGGGPTGPGGETSGPPGKEGPGR
jgi:hypothetical protein